jgi:hypothetical protein
MNYGNQRLSAIAAAAALALVVLFPWAALAQAAKIVCWKDASGKVIGCGDKLPPEYQGSATKELDSRGVTRRQVESVDDATRRRQREQEAAAQRAEQERNSLVQKRQDTALLETYSTEKEIDLKRDRDLQVIDLQIEQLTVALKNTTQRHTEARSRVDTLEKSKKSVSAAQKEELARITLEKQRFEESIAAKNKEKDELRSKYAEYRRRFAELKAQQVAGTAKK